MPDRIDYLEQLRRRVKGSNPEEPIGQEVEFIETPPMAKYLGYDLRGKKGKIVADLGYGVVRVSVPDIPRTITADIFRDVKRQSNPSVPKTRVSSLGFAELELPVARAVEALVGEGTLSSGFHEKLNQRWTIVFEGIVIPKVAMAAQKAGLEVSYREEPKGTGHYFTDVSLPHVGKEEIGKATTAFNKFAELYEREAGQVRSKNPGMITDVDTCLKDLADWYIRNRRGITEPELESILLKHCGSEAEIVKFTKFLESEPGQMRFKTLLRELRMSALELTAGLTLTQARQMKFLKELAPYVTVEVACQTCHIGPEYRSAAGARAFILEHIGHATWVKYGEKEIGGR